MHLASEPSAGNSTPNSLACARFSDSTATFEENFISSWPSSPIAQTGKGGRRKAHVERLRGSGTPKGRPLLWHLLFEHHAAVSHKRRTVDRHLKIGLVVGRRAHLGDALEFDLL